MKSTRKRGVKHAFTLEIQSLAVNANGVTKPPSKNLLNLSGFNLGKLFDPMNLLEPILAKKIGLSCKKKAVAKGRTKTATFNTTTMAYEWEEPQIFHFTSVIYPSDSGPNNQPKEFKFHLTKIHPQLGTKVALLSSVTFDIAEDLKPHQVTIPLMKLTTESFSEVKPPDTKRKFSIIKKEAASAGTLELKFFISPVRLDDDSVSSEAHTNTEGSDTETDDTVVIETGTTSTSPAMKFLDDHFKSRPRGKSGSKPNTPTGHGQGLGESTTPSSVTVFNVDELEKPVTPVLDPLGAETFDLTNSEKQPVEKKPEPTTPTQPPVEKPQVETQPVEQQSEPTTPTEKQPAPISSPAVEPPGLIVKQPEIPIEDPLDIPPLVAYPEPPVDPSLIPPLVEYPEPLEEEPVTLEPKTPSTPIREDVLAEHDLSSSLDSTLEEALSSTEETNTTVSDLPTTTQITNQLVELDEENTALQNQLFMEESKIRDLQNQHEKVLKELEQAKRKVQDKVQKKDQKIIRLKSKLEKKNQKQYHPLLVASVWGLVAAVLTSFAFPYIAYTETLLDVESLTNRIVSLVLGNFILYTMISYFGAILATNAKFLHHGTLLLHTIEDWNEQLYLLAHRASTACIGGFAVGLFCKIFDGIFFRWLVGYEGRIDIGQVSFVMRIFYAIYEGLTLELFGRYFILLAVMEGLRFLKTILVHKKGSLPPAVGNLLGKLEPLLKEREDGGKHVDGPMILSMGVSAVIYVLWCFAGQLQLYPVDGVFSFLLAFIRVLVMDGVSGLVFAYLFIIEERIELVAIAHIVKQVIVQL